MNNFVTQGQVYKAAIHWYGSTVNRDELCLAENRLMRGEVPYEGFYETSISKSEG